MAKRHMNNCSPSLIIRDVQIKTTATCHLTPVRKAIIRKPTNQPCWRGCGQKEPCWWECRLVQPLWKTVGRFLKKFKMELPSDTMIPPACRILCCGGNRQIHTDYYRVLWRKRDGKATLSRGERPNPCLDGLLLLFWAHYIEDGPYLLTMHRFALGSYRKQRRGCC